MKKLSKVVLTTTLLATLVASSVNATTVDSLTEEIFAVASKYGMTDANKVSMERYISSYDVSVSELESVLSNVESIAAIMDAEGVTDYNDLSKESKASVKSLANSTAGLLGLSLEIADGTVKVYDVDGSLVVSFSKDNDTLVYTGNATFAAIAGSTAIIAIAAVILNTKKRA